MNGTPAGRRDADRRRVENPVGAGDPAGQRRHGGTAEVGGNVGDVEFGSFVPVDGEAVSLCRRRQVALDGRVAERRIDHDGAHVPPEFDSAVDLGLDVAVENARDGPRRE